ncbi:MAG: filamentous hemagglutinin N-terminal domain-containing protein, partial [Gammaproteobacteria bacterium]|nr:filamentous hemagglutinin N-terminal domain-containing protein [Gammaproteobacteria bacterium]
MSIGRAQWEFWRRIRAREFCRVLCYSLYVFFLGSTAVAEPQGGRIVGGEGSIRTGKDTVVEQSSRDLVVDWERFDVGKDESVHFRQESAAHSVLNRIYDHKPSEIWGRVTARGRVWLLNPNGVFFGRGSRVSVGSLVASGLWMEKEDFLAGRYVLSRRGERGGTVRNAGVLEASSGGIGLAGGEVVNEGEVRARAGRVTLAGGERLVVDFDGDGLLGFTLAEGGSGALVRNEGQLEGGTVSLGLRQASGVFDGVVNNEGMVRALGIEERGGVAVLVGSEVEHTGRIAARGGVAVEGDATAEAAAGGAVEMQGVTVSHGGEIEVSGATGGTARLEALQSLEVSGRTRALGETGAGGDIRLLGDRVNVRSGASADASGATQGGAVRVGGGWQGLERGVRNAWETLVERDVSLRADGGRGAGGRGDGGEVVVWSDGTTRFAGRISARGGARGGDGGRAEVSGREHLYMRGLADLRAPWGRAGRLLLDPGRVDLCHEGTTGCDMAAATPDDTDGPDRFSDSQLATMLGTASVTVATSAASTGDEDIVVSSDFDLSWTAANGLTLDAGRDIQLAGSINGGTMGTLALNFGRNLDFGGASLTAMTVSATGGTTGTQAITGPSGGSTWELTATGAGTLTVGTQSVAFSAVENLQGGDGVDAFTVSAAHTGDLMGGGGADTFALNAVLTGTASGEAGADTFILGALGSADSLEGGADTDDALGGRVAAAATWTLALGADMYVIAGTLTQSFSGIENLQGGSMADTFLVNAAHAGDLMGGDGPDTFNLNNALTGMAGGGMGDDTFTLGASGSASMGLDGGGGTNTLTGRNAAAAWTLQSGADMYVIAGTLTQSFRNIEDLQGGSMADAFTVSVAHTGDLMGGGEADTFTLNTGGSVSGDIMGGMGADTFDFNGGTVSGTSTVAGGAGADVLDFAGVSAGITVSLSGTPDAAGFAGGVTGGATVSAFAGIRTLVGGSGTDELAGLASGSWTVGTSDSYESASQTLGFSAIEDLQGGMGVDT